MENFADVVNEITCLCVTIFHRDCQIFKKGEHVVTMPQFIEGESAASLPGWTRG